MFCHRLPVGKKQTTAYWPIAYLTTRDILTEQIQGIVGCRNSFVEAANLYTEELMGYDFLAIVMTPEA